jgi:hypothetical protein
LNTIRTRASAPGCELWPATNTWSSAAGLPHFPWRNEEDSPAQPAEADGAELFAEAEYRNFLVGRALRLMQAEFQASTWKACWECVVNSKPAAAVAAELDTTVEGVWAAKARVLRRLREELQGLLE